MTMTNPIDNGPRPAGVLGSNRSPSSGSAGAQPERVDAKGPARDAGVESERLQLIKDRIENAPDVDMARVEAIKQRISEGQYPIDAARIAEKFIQLESLLND
jgi:negative regulator of flagellin synthesis FlgM